jgi:hypothetical protein
MRCRICDRVMETFEMKKKKPNGEWEDTCAGCLSDAHYYETTTETFQFKQHEGGRSGLKVINLDYFDSI